MSDQSAEHERQVYNLLDFIGDVGGLLDGVQYIFYPIISIFSAICGSNVDSYFYHSLFED